MERMYVDIKEEDWSVWLSDSSYFTQRKDYILLSEQAPILESIVVYVNQEAIYGWSYVEETNMLSNLDLCQIMDP
jgi:hypothetical protein